MYRLPTRFLGLTAKILPAVIFPSPTTELKRATSGPIMGRRPNQLILEYFERGPKLEDASNRYQHTCKSCGEKVSSPALRKVDGDS
jgi:hypothetical protein